MKLIDKISVAVLIFYVLLLGLFNFIPEIVGSLSRDSQLILYVVLMAGLFSVLVANIIYGGNLVFRSLLSKAKKNQ